MFRCFKLVKWNEYILDSLKTLKTFEQLFFLLNNRFVPLCPLQFILRTCSTVRSTNMYNMVHKDLNILLNYTRIKWRVSQSCFLIREGILEQLSRDSQFWSYSPVRRLPRTKSVSFHLQSKATIRCVIVEHADVTDHRHSTHVWPSFHAIRPNPLIIWIVQVFPCVSSLPCEN